MTFSIVARSDDGNLLGVAVASKFLAAGAVTPAAKGGVGALSSQALPNLNYREQGLTFMRHGYNPVDAIAGMTAADSGSDQRQLGMVDAKGASAAFTGTGTTYWAGHRTGDGFAIQGNILAGPEVVDEMVAAWKSSHDMRFAERLVAVLAAGDAAGGDSRGRQCASILVVGENANFLGLDDVAMDLRVDDHVEPIPELARLVQLHRETFPDE